MADTEKDVNRAAAAPQEEASAAQAAPEAPQPETQDAEKTEKKEKHAEGKAHAELAALKTKLEQAEKKLAETKDTLLRTAAEYENFRKRSARDKRKRHYQRQCKRQILFHFFLLFSMFFHHSHAAMLFCTGIHGYACVYYSMAPQACST